ncbi:salicylate hydroxylase [Brucella endophytica]|uniref:Salicylate hydroxylase n=1 Tax=Brucella endophytica TaxID=1963359 RepID=A0A916SB32_9HYPH|nr:FAD-binding protein [Brucella endophytica]GGA92347.1 salicylate hydroxylase [Brucella endophytica]
MTTIPAKHIIISGAGIAGLTAALALAAKGFSVSIFDRTPALSEVGAGLQLAPNATRLLARLGVLDRLLPQAVTPDALYLKNGANGKTLTRMGLGPAAEARWNAPYIVCHRADLQAALVRAAEDHPAITLKLGANVISHSVSEGGVTVQIDAGDRIEEHQGALLIGCDGVWSMRRSVAAHDGARFTGHIAWRASLAAGAVPDIFQTTLGEKNSVSAWLGRGVHFIAYPLKAGKSFNFVAITRGRDPGREWSSKGDSIALQAAFSGWHPSIHAVIRAAAEQWTFWPLFQMPSPRFILSARTVLLGDAAHAMTPFAAQGAAMAIEDACALAAALSGEEAEWPAALAMFNEERTARIAKVARRGSLNRFAYHAAGPLALGRNMLFRARPPERFLDDLDWLYGYDAVAAVQS